MGTSHEAPMMRGIEEWNRHAASDSGHHRHDPYGGNGEWSFRRNADALKAYWRDGIRRMVRRRTSRAWSRSACAATATSSLPDGDGIDLMSTIIDTQRQILAEETGE